MRASILIFLYSLSIAIAIVTPWSCAGGRSAFINEIAYGSTIPIGRAVELITSSNKTNFDPTLIQVRRNDG